MQKGLIKTKEEILFMKKLGKTLSFFFDELEKIIIPGIDSYELEKKFLELCNKEKVIPSCKGYYEGLLPPFPTGLCLSINQQSVHCFPRKGVILKDGDIVNIDTVISSNGLHVDSAHCYPVGKVPTSKLKLLETSKNALNSAISKVSNNTKIGQISHTIQKTVEKEGFNVLKDYEGHGIGYSMHEYPEIPCFGSKHDGPKLKEGMTICIESLICEGDDRVINTSEWETEMADGKCFCIFEHTVLVTKDGYEILT